jgi:hypothetical protein
MEGHAELGRLGRLRPVMEAVRTGSDLSPLQIVQALA